MVDDKDVGFALRVPPKLKDAAAELTNLGSIYQRKDGLLRELKVPSINEAFRVLIAEGLRSVLNTLEEEITPLQQGLSPDQTIMEFLIPRPDVRRVFAADLPDGSPAQVWLAKQQGLNEFDLDEEARLGPPSFSRVDAANTFARYQDRLDRLISVKKIIGQSLVAADAKEEKPGWDTNVPEYLWAFRNVQKNVTTAEQAMLLGRLNEASTTAPGYTNRNDQTVIRKTEARGNDHNQFIYVLQCKRCAHEYGANGSDIFQRRCPSCDGGKPGLRIDAQEVKADGLA
jgi:hypothetical protein